MSSLVRPGWELVDRWTGTCWNGCQRQARWNESHIWLSEEDLPCMRVSRRLVGVERVLEMFAGTTIVAFGVGADIETAVAHLREVDRGTPLTLPELIARWYGPLPSEPELVHLRALAELSGTWPAHTPGTHCYACGARISTNGRALGRRAAKGKRTA